MPVTSEANVQNTFSFGSAVDERTRNKLYGVKSVGFTYLVACLARQWIKEREIIDMRVRAKSDPLFCSLATLADVGETTSYVGELVVGELTRWRNDRLPGHLAGHVHKWGGWGPPAALPQD